MKRIRSVNIPVWRPPFFAAVALMLVAGLLVFRLGTLVPGLSNSEIMTRVDSSNLRHIIHNPINAPYKLLVYGLIRVHHHGALALRGVAAGYGIIALSLFYYILKRWQSGRIAGFGLLLFGTSSWFLHTARSGTPDILLFGLLILVAAGLWLRSSHKRTLALYWCVVAVAVSMYIPGFIWLALVGIIWRRQVIIEELRRITLWRIIFGIVLFLVLIAPLGYAMYLQPSLLLTAAGLPQHLPAMRTLAHNLLNIPLFLFFRGPQPQPTIWLGRLPILDIFDIAMFALGLYAYARHGRLDRAGLLLGIVVIGTLLVTAGGPVTITLLIPFIYLIIASGITYMIQEWFSIFPLNPFARSLGVSLMILAILASSGYQLDRYYVAWPHSPATKAAFTRQT